MNISAKQLEKVRECGKYLTLSNIKFNNLYSANSLVYSAALEHFKALDSTDLVLESEIQTFLQNFYSDDIDSAKTKYQMELKGKVFKRFFSYLFTREIVAIDVPFSFQIPATTINGITIDKVYGTVDYVLKTNDGFEAIMVQGGKLTTSSRARSAVNKIENNMLLLAVAAGLSEQYENLTTSLYSFSSKDDKADYVSPDYPKADKTFVSLNPMSKDTAIEKLLSALSISCSADCENCRMRSNCKIGRITDLIPISNAVEVAKAKSAATPTEKQLDAINTVEGQLCILAVPGAGKTWTMVKRMANMVHCGISPSNILAVTFSKKACEELADRLRLEIDGPVLPDVFTFNSLGYRILRDNFLLLGRQVELATELDLKLICERVVNETPLVSGLSYGDFESPRYGLVGVLLKEFSIIRQAGKEAYLEHTAKDGDSIVAMYDKFDCYLKEKNFINYDEQIELAVELLEAHPQLVDAYRRIYKYVVADEFQDTNETQWKLLQLLVGGNGNLCVVGDDDQSIYGFRGANVDLLLDFKKYYPSAKVITMSDNFRCNDKICDTCNALIRSNVNRFNKELVAHKVADSKPLYFKGCSHDKVVSLVKQGLKHYTAGDIAVLARNNKELVDIKSKLSEQGIPSRSPKDYMVEDAMFVLIKDIITLKINGLDQDAELYRYLKIVADVDDGTFVKGDASISLYASMFPLIESNETIKEAFRKLYLVFDALDFEPSLSEAIKKIGVLLFDSGHLVIEQIVSMIEEHNITKLNDLLWLLRNMARFHDESRVGYGADPDFVNLLTAHDSKGKEFRFVIVIDFELFDTNKDAADEVVRLAFVALSRAKDSLFITENSYVGATLFDSIKDTVVVM